MEGLRKKLKKRKSHGYGQQCGDCGVRGGVWIQVEDRIGEINDDEKNKYQGQL